MPSLHLKRHCTDTVLYYGCQDYPEVRSLGQSPSMTVHLPTKGQVGQEEEEEQQHVTRERH